MGSEENCSTVFSYFLLVRWARRRGSEGLGHFTHNVLMLMELDFLLPILVLSSQEGRMWLSEKICSQSDALLFL